MNSLLKFLILLHFGGISLSVKGQYEINSSVWIDEYTAQHHINQYLSNLLFSYDYYQKWNGETQQFESALPAQLTYAPFASKEVKVDAKELDYTQRNFLLKWEDFDAKRIDSLMKNSKMIYSTFISYDDQGRITKSTYKNYEHKPAGERIDYNVAYNNSDTLNKLLVEVSQSEGLLIKKKNISTLEYSFSHNLRLLKAITTYESALENTTFENSYSYDTLGRLIKFNRVPNSDIYLDRSYSYKTSPFNLDSAKNDYGLLKIPSIQYWLRSYPDSSLNIIAYQKFERNRNAMVEYSYLVDSEQNRLFMLRPYPHYYGTNMENNSCTRSYCSISQSQNLNDTMPYDPNYKPRYIGTFHSQCSVEERYTTPPGLVNAGSVEGYKRSEHSLPNGWKRLTYQRGSGAPSRFAPGYPVSVRFDILYDKHLILDPNGVVRYIIDYDKLIKIEEVKMVKEK